MRQRTINFDAAIRDMKNARLTTPLGQAEALIEEMLAALKAVVGDGYCSVDPSIADHDFVPKRTIEAVRDVIAKAEAK